MTFKVSYDRSKPALLRRPAPGVLAGKPTIRGTRLSVEYILNLLSHGTTREEILAEYDSLTDEDITACVLFFEPSVLD